VRSVNTSPPVAVDEQKSAKERARRDAAEVKAIDKARAKDEAQDQRAAAEQKKAQAKERERCDKARRELDQAKDARAELHRQPATIQQIQKSDGEIAKRRSRSCARVPRFSAWLQLESGGLRPGRSTASIACSRIPAPHDSSRAASLSMRRHCRATTDALIQPQHVAHDVPWRLSVARLADEIGRHHVNDRAPRWRGADDSPKNSASTAASRYGSW